jgi:hypothetical protein
MSPPLLHTKLTTHPHPVYPSNAWELQYRSLFIFVSLKGQQLKIFLHIETFETIISRDYF